MQRIQSPERTGCSNRACRWRERGPRGPRCSTRRSFLDGCPCIGTVVVDLGRLAARVLVVGWAVAVVAVGMVVAAA